MEDRRHEAGMTAYGLMLHHFSGGRHPKGQGAITADQFATMINYLGPSNFLQPEDWIAKSVSGRLSETDLCITFDDSLLCQYEIAKPVLDALGLKAFWLVYSSVFQGKVERLELYRHYRTVQFQEVDEFYRRFFDAVSESEYGASFVETLATIDIEGYLPQFSFYSREDRLFRYVRDKLLGQQAYYQMMDALIAGDPSYSPSEAAKSLWMQDEDLRRLTDEGHIVGLHSYSHPTEMSQLPRDMQLDEYAKNAEHLTSVIGAPPRAMSHPCGSYNADTLSILAGLGIEIGFVASLNAGNGSLLEQRRNDHSHVAIEMGIR
jgi:peptidoglycan/xylan/chitin deacetylase (PgdA/CDA1 family)